MGIESKTGLVSVPCLAHIVDSEEVLVQSLKPLKD